MYLPQIWQKKGMTSSDVSGYSQALTNRIDSLKAIIDSINNNDEQCYINGKLFTASVGIPVPENFKEEIEKIVCYAVLRDYLLEAVNTKKAMIEKATNQSFVFDEPAPIYIGISTPKKETLLTIDDITKELSTADIIKYIECLAYTALVGKNVLHANGKLTMLMGQLPQIPQTRTMVLGTEIRDYFLNRHHTIEQLSKIHESINEDFRIKQNAVNFIKAKIENELLRRNQEIIDRNNAAEKLYLTETRRLQTLYYDALDSYNKKQEIAKSEFDKEKANTISEIHTLRLAIPTEYQSIIDEFDTPKK